MSGSPPVSSRRQRAALAFLVAGMVALVLAHLAPGPFGDSRGWHLWPRTWNYLGRGRFGSDFADTLGITSFLTVCMLVASAPFALGPLSRSRLLKAFGSIGCGIGAAVMGYFVLGGFQFRANPVFLLLSLAPALTLVGVLLVPSLPRPTLGPEPTDTPI